MHGTSLPRTSVLQSAETAERLGAMPLSAGSPPTLSESGAGQSGREGLAIGTLLFLVYLALGGYIAIVRGYLPGDAVARLANAYLVFHGVETKLSSIGFVWPPIPTLLIVPLTLVQPLMDSWMAVVLISAAFMAAACVLVGAIAAICGIPAWWRRLLVVLFATNPLIVVFGINGMSEAILLAFALAAFYWLIRYWQSGNNGHLVIASALLGLLPMIRYEMAVLAAGAGLLLAFPSSPGGGRWRRLEPHTLQGRLIGYAVLAGYPTLLWALASWQIMGSPVYFLVNDLSALNVSQIDLGGQQMGPLAAFQLALEIWVSAFPVGLVASLAAVAVGVLRRSPFLVILGLLPLAVPLLQGFLLGRGATVALVRYFIMVVPLAYVSLLASLRPLLPAPARSYEHRSENTGDGIPTGPGRRETAATSSYRTDAPGKKALWRSVALGGIALLLLGSSVSSGMLLASGQHQDFEHETWISLTSREQVKDQRIPETMAVGRALARIVPEGSTVLLDEYQYGYAAMLGANKPRMFVNHTHPQYEQALRRPQEFVDYLLVPNPAGRGALYAINRFHPKLYSQGAPWAELVDELPPTEIGWRLYRVVR